MSSEGFAIGVDIGGTNIRAAKISPSGAIIQKRVVSTSRDPHSALRLIIELISEIGGHSAAAVGIGVPGRVDGLTGDVVSGGYLDLSAVGLKSAIEAEFSRPVVVLNDCSMALVAETRVGAARGLRNVVMLTIGTGIGGAVINDGKLVNGKRSAGQFGHLVVNVNGEQCRCGQRGCVETESSGSSLRRHLHEAGYRDDAMFEDILPAARSGDAAALGVMRAWSGPLRAAIRTLSAAFDPDTVLIGGGMGGAALQALDFLPQLSGWYDVELRAAALGDDAGVIGAGLAAHELLERRSQATGATGRRLLMVNGVPASGKSSIARAISDATGWPVLGLDTIKTPFLELIEGVDRAFNRILGRASYKSIFSVIGEAPRGSTFIVDAWFGFQPADVLGKHMSEAGISAVAELWCHAPPEVVGQRYASRVAKRALGHPGLSYVPELMDLARQAKPMGLGPVLDIDATQSPDIGSIVSWAEHVFASASQNAIEAAAEE